VEAAVQIVWLQIERGHEWLDVARRGDYRKKTIRLTVVMLSAWAITVIILYRSSGSKLRAQLTS